MKQTYSQRYPLRAKIQASIAGLALAILFLPMLPPVTVTIGNPAFAGDGIKRGSGR